MNRRGFLGTMLGAGVVAVARIYPTPAPPTRLMWGDAPAVLESHAVGSFVGRKTMVELAREMENDEIRRIAKILSANNELLTSLAWRPESGEPKVP